MIVELAVAFVLVTLTLLVHGVGIAALQWLVRRRPNYKALLGHPARQIGLRVSIAWALFVLHGLEVWIYAMFYWLVGGVRRFSEAVYFSAANYSTVGENHPVLGRQWGLVAAIEGINGVLLVGWSTAFLVSIIGHLRRRGA